MKVLLVDDDPIVRFTLSEMLDELECDHDACVDGSDCVARVTKNPRRYALILMDINMPVCTGLEAAQQIRNAKNRFVRHIPIIAITADAQWQTSEQYKAGGFSDLLTKPVSFQELKRRIELFSQEESSGA